MDDLVTTGALGLIGIYLALALLLIGISSVVFMIFTSVVTGNFLGSLPGTIFILAAVSLYAGIGIWLRRTGRI